MTDKHRWHTLAWVGGLIFLVLGVRDFYYLEFLNGVFIMGHEPYPPSARFFTCWAIALMLLALWALGAWADLKGGKPRQIVDDLLRMLYRIPRYLRYVASGIFILLPVVLFVLIPLGFDHLGYWSRVFSVGVCTLAATFFFNPQHPNPRWFLGFSVLMLISGTVFAAADWLVQVTPYPFSLNWSEGNRLYDYSMLFGRDRYLTTTSARIAAFISLGRQLLWAAAFLIPNIDITGVRLWDALTWILPPFFLGLFLALPCPSSVGTSTQTTGTSTQTTGTSTQTTGTGQSIWYAVIFGLWSFTFLAQGPIYAPLVISALLVVLALRARRLWVSILLVAIAAYYATISRFTWMYAAGLWAGMLAFLDIPDPDFLNGKWRNWRPLVRPFVLGLTGYAAAQFLPNPERLLRGESLFPSKVSVVVDLSNDIGRQPYLWERLLPNPTYAPGILLGTLWAGLPLVLFLLFLLYRKIWKPNWAQSLATGIIATAFLAVGLIISVKVGGGSNLHNLDMFWLTLVLIAGWIWQHEIVPNFPRLIQSRSFLIALGLIIIAPTTHNLQYGYPLRLPPAEDISEALTIIQREAAAGAARGEVLFIDQRQLLTFGIVHDIPLVPEYEKKLLMDRAMANDKAYFKAFHEDIQKHRFSLIITEPARQVIIADEARTFAQENNDWVSWVTEPLLKDYKPLFTFEPVGVQLLVPR